MCDYLYYIVFFFKNFYWSIADLQCHVDFCYTGKWISYTYTCDNSFFKILSPYRPLQSIKFPVLYSRFSLIICFRYAAAKSLQSCPTLCDPIDGSPPGSTIPGILQARTLEWVAISFSNA